MIPRVEVLMYITLHVFIGISVLISLKKETKALFDIVGLFMIIIIYVFKNDCYDIPFYIASVTHPYYEPGFSFLLKLLYLVFRNPKVVILIVQLLLLLMTIALVLQYLQPLRKKIIDIIYLIIISLISPAFCLGVNNALRQYMSSLIVLAAVNFIFFNKGKKCKTNKIIGYTLGILSSLFHLSGLFFFFFIVVTIWLAKLLCINGVPVKEVHIVLSKNITRIIMTLVTILGFVGLIKVAEVTKYARYINCVIIAGRYPFFIKYFYIVLYYLLSEIHFLGADKKDDPDVEYLRFVRFNFLILMLPFNFMSQLWEMGSRIMFYYFSLEMVLLVVFLKSNLKKPSFWIILANAFAVNVWKVLGCY